MTKDHLRQSSSTGFETICFLPIAANQRKNISETGSHRLGQILDKGFNMLDRVIRISEWTARSVMPPRRAPDQTNLNIRTLADVAVG